MKNRDYTWPAEKYGCLLNIDCDATAYFCDSINWDLTDLETKAYNYFDKYLDKGISDMVYNLDGAVPSKNGEWRGELFERTEDEGGPVDYSQSKAFKASYLIYKKTEVDPHRIWFERAWEEGMRPWISFRMNDVHYANSPSGHSKFFYKAKRNGWMVGDYNHPRNWYGYALDYAVEEVREHFLGLIAEQTQNYDAFGIDLDFHRIIRCFKTLDESNCVYMTDFLRKVRAIADQAESKWGHPWRIMVRLTSRVDWAKLYGFDVRLLAKEGLVDAFIPSAYWSSTDSDIPISQWKEASGGLPVFWGIEVNTVNMHHFITGDTVAGYMLGADAAGADGMYQYNTFNAPWAWNLGTVEGAKANPTRRFVVTMNDIPVPLGYSELEPKYLPLPVAVGGKAEIGVNVGDVNTNEPLLVFVGVKSDGAETPDETAKALAVTADGVVLAPLGRTGASYLEKYYPEYYERELEGRYPWRIFTFEVPAEQRANIKKRTELVFECTRGAQVCYVEVANGELEL